MNLLIVFEYKLNFYSVNVIMLIIYRILKNRINTFILLKYYIYMLILKNEI